MTTSTVPVTIDDPVNVAILRISEDRVAGFQRDPLSVVARESGVELPVVIERIRAMLEAGTIRRVRQTLMTTSLAPGSLVAWEVSQERLQAASTTCSSRTRSPATWWCAPPTRLLPDRSTGCGRR